MTRPPALDTSDYVARQEALADEPLRAAGPTPGFFRGTAPTGEPVAVKLLSVLPAGINGQTIKKLIGRV